jgi:transcriptional regulator with XRE-family HTH domain
MDIKKLKHYNLLRLCREHRTETPAKLAQLLGVSIQYTSKILSGKAGIGDRVIKKLSKKWGIDEKEFYKDESAEALTSPKPDNWELKLIYESLQRQIDELSRKLDNITKMETGAQGEKSGMGN